MAFDQIKYNNNFKKDNYDETRFLIPKGNREILKSFSKIKGISMSQIIINAIENYYKINISAKEPKPKTEIQNRIALMRCDFEKSYINLFKSRKYDDMTDEKKENCHTTYKKLNKLFSLIDNETDSELILKLFGNCENANQLQAISKSISDSNSKYKWENL